MNKKRERFQTTCAFQKFKKSMDTQLGGSLRRGVGGAGGARATRGTTPPPPGRINRRRRQYSLSQRNLWAAAAGRGLRSVRSVLCDGKSWAAAAVSGVARAIDHRCGSLCPARAAEIQRVSSPTDAQTCRPTDQPAGCLFASGITPSPNHTQTKSNKTTVLF